jgi:hypothetical protein
MVQNVKVSGTATKVTKGDNGHVSVRLYNTTVAEKNVRHGQTCITLNSGGYQTETTKRRINQFANEFCGGAFSVFAKKGVWFIQHGDEAILFEDNIEFTI